MKRLTLSLCGFFALILTACAQQEPATVYFTKEITPESLVKIYKQLGELAKEENDVRVIIPLFSAIPQEYTSQMTHVCDFEVQLGWRRQYCGIEKLENA